MDLSKSLKRTEEKERLRMKTDEDGKNVETIMEGWDCASVCIISYFLTFGQLTTVATGNSSICELGWYITPLLTKP